MGKILYRPKTMLEIYKLLPEGTPIQLINNRFYMSPAPRYDHFSVMKLIFRKLDSYVELHQLGTVVFAPVDVFMGTRNAVQPDVFFISKENSHLIKEDGIHGAPDLIAEVLSPKNKNVDLVKKKDVYEQSGVKEYFIVEPFDKSVTTYYLKEGVSAEQKKLKGRLISKVLKKDFDF